MACSSQLLIRSNRRLARLLSFLSLFLFCNYTKAEFNYLLDLLGHTIIILFPQEIICFNNPQNSRYSVCFSLILFLAAAILNL